MSFGQKLKQLRLARSLSQAKLAEILGIPQTTISDFEQCKYEPDVTVAKNIARFFGKTIDEMA